MKPWTLYYNSRPSKPDSVLAIPVQMYQTIACKQPWKQNSSEIDPSFFTFQAPRVSLCNGACTFPFVFVSEPRVRIYVHIWPYLPFPFNNCVWLESWICTGCLQGHRWDSELEYETWRMVFFKLNTSNWWNHAILLWIINEMMSHMYC